MNGAADRLPYLDGLRVAAFALLIPYHVGMYYVSWDWHVKSPAASSALEPFMLLSAPWRLGLLFLIAGAACQGLFAQRGAWGFLKERSLRLLPPLLFGMAVIVVPQAYFELKTKAPHLLNGGGYLDFWAAYLQGGKYCWGSACMVVPTWNHLWFLPYLWVYAFLGPLLAGLSRWAARQPPDWMWWLLPALPLILARLFVMPHFPSTHDLVHDLYNHVQYAYLFALGWASRTPVAQGFWVAAWRGRRGLLALALLAWGVLIVYFLRYNDGAEPPAALRNTMRVVWGLLAWWAMAAACGWAQQVFRAPAPWLRWCSGAVFCLYVLHQSVIVLLTQALKPLALPWGLEALLLIVLTAGICLAAYALLRQVPLLRGLVGIAQANKPWRYQLGSGRALRSR